MNEESRKPNAELNEAALENVSGGGEPGPGSYIQKAQQICNACLQNHGAKCEDFIHLAKYLQKEGYYSIQTTYKACPFYPKHYND